MRAHARRVGRAPPVGARPGHTRHPPGRPHPLPTSAAWAAHTRQGSGEGSAPGRLQRGAQPAGFSFPKRPAGTGSRRATVQGLRTRRGAKPRTCSDGGLRGAASRPQMPESPQAGENSPVTTEVPRTRHEPLPGPPGKGQRTTHLGAPGWCACAQALLRSRGSPYARSLWAGGREVSLGSCQVTSRERELFSLAYLLLFKHL